MLITSAEKRPATEEEIRMAVQPATDQVLEHYENPNFFITKLAKILGPLFIRIINNNIKMETTIPAFRTNVLQACSYENWLKALTSLTGATTLADLRTRIRIEGPGINPKSTDEEFLRACFFHEKRHFEKEFTVKASGPGAYGEIIEYEKPIAHSIVHHGLSTMFFSPVFLPIENRASDCDLSWTQAGQQAMKGYDLAAEKAALVIQRFMPRIPELKHPTPKPTKPHTPLPTILLFERHWESLPKKVLRTILEQYAGYNALCTETPCDVMEPQIISSLNTVLTDEQELEQAAKQYLSTPRAQQYLSQAKLSLSTPWEDWLFDDLELCLRNLVSSQESAEYAKTLKDLPAKIYYQKTLLDFQPSISIIGIDIAQDDYRALTDAPTMRSRSEVIQALEEQRNQQLFKGLLQARAQNEGTIMLCGAWHAEYFMKMIHEQGLEDQFVVRFIHTDRPYANNADEAYGSLIDPYRKQQKDSPLSVKAITDDIMSEVEQKNTVFIDQPIPQTTTSAYLETLLKTPCLPRSRPGMHIDACFNRRLSDDEKARFPKTSFEEIERNGKPITVIRDINAKEVAEKIRPKATVRPK